MRSISLCFCITILLSSCTMAPRVANHPYSVQPRIVSVAQWQDIAKTVVDIQIIPAIQGSEINSVYFETPDCNEFATAFNTYMITDVVSKGLQVAQTPENAITIKWGAQIVNNDKDPWYPGIIMGTIEVVGFFLVGSPVILPPNTIELILTTQVNMNQTIFSRMTNNYYLPVSSKSHFYIPPEKKLLDPEYLKFAHLDYSHYVPYESKRDVVVMYDDARIFDKAGVSNVLYVSSAGSLLSAIGEKKNWYLVKVDNQSGWVSKGEVSER
jgi:hypothetical protein